MKGIKSIKSITMEGINYIDEKGAECFIDFKECNENWIQYRKRNEKLDDEKVIEIRKNDRSVGQRDIYAKPCFIEFFTRPFTRFEFEMSSECLESKEEFKKTQQSIIAAGWTTIDFS